MAKILFLGGLRQESPLRTEYLFHLVDNPRDRQHPKGCITRAKLPGQNGKPVFTPSKPNIGFTELVRRAQAVHPGLSCLFPGTLFFLPSTIARRCQPLSARISYRPSLIACDPCPSAMSKRDFSIPTSHWDHTSMSFCSLSCSSNIHFSVNSFNRDGSRRESGRFMSFFPE